MHMISGAILLVAAAILLSGGLIAEGLGAIPQSRGVAYGIAYAASSVLGLAGLLLMLVTVKERSRVQP
jgi:hypothetical protein